jgi:hypothetical protein
MKNTNSNNANFQLENRYKLLTELTILIGHQKFGSQWKKTVLDSLESGLSIHHIEECILHLGAYYGLPRALQSFSELNKMNLKSDSMQASDNNESRINPDLEVRVRTFMPNQFNFFQQPDIQIALNNVHPDFGTLAGTTATWLCSRGVLTPLDRAHITLISDIFQNVFSGPYQIHIRMMLQSGATPEFISSSIGHLKSLVTTSTEFSIPASNIKMAQELLPELYKLNAFYIPQKSENWKNSEPPNSMAAMMNYNKESYFH